jgi:NADPH-dependent curcumin reductase CurA
MSIDAAMRVWISGEKSYVPPVHPGDLMPGQCVGEIVLSKSDKFKLGDIVLGPMTW